jgi:uncharacterized protein YpuA (DUF1002 family)
MDITSANILRQKTYEERNHLNQPTEEVRRYNRAKINELIHLTELKQKRNVAEKEETILADAVDHFIKRTPDNPKDAQKKVAEIVKYHQGN